MKSRCVTEATGRLAAQSGHGQESAKAIAWPVQCRIAFRLNIPNKTQRLINKVWTLKLVALDVGGSAGQHPKWPSLCEAGAGLCRDASAPMDCVILKSLI